MTSAVQKPPAILLLSTADWDNPFWTNKQHMAVEFARRGHRVLYVESLGLRPPSGSGRDLLRILRRIRRGLGPPRQVQENIWVWSPIVIPYHHLSWVRAANKILLNVGLRLASLATPVRPAWLWTYSPLTSLLCDVRGYERTVYHCVDDIAAQPGMPRSIIESSERVLATEADVVFVTSRSLLAKLAPLNARTHYHPNVVDYSHFSKALDPETTVPADLAVFPKPRIGFVGAISEYKVDMELLRDVALANPQWSFVMIGQVGEGEPSTKVDALLGLPNVNLLGGRPYSALPGYLKGLDVAIIPSRINEYTTAMFPMKFFEYLAAGLPVVATPLASLNEFSSLVHFASNAADFAEALSRCLRGEVPSLGARLSAAAHHTYQSRTERMLAQIDDAGP